MLRLTGGEYRNRRLETPKGLEIRPTREVMRLALFNMLYNRIVKARVLELFAGCGAVGFEALSRGATEVTFVDNSNVSITLIRRTAQTLECSNRVRTDRRDWHAAVRELGKSGATFDFIFADPPWKDDRELAILQDVLDAGLLAPHGWLAIESPVARKTVFPTDRLPIRTDRNYGISRLTVFSEEEA